MPAAPGAVPIYQNPEPGTFTNPEPAAFIFLDLTKPAYIQEIKFIVKTDHKFSKKTGSAK